MSEQWKDNQRFALEEKDNLIVAASAGSGKTTVLIEKLLRILKNGGDLRKMVVMTFTDLAATELKEKLLSKLMETIRNDDPSSDNLKAQLKYLPFADISTIHTYCYGLFKKYFNEIGEDYYTDILEPEEATALYSSMVEAVLAEFYDKGEEDFLEVGRYFYSKDRKFNKLIKTIDSVHQFLENIEDKEEFCKYCERQFSLPFEERKYVQDYLSDIRKKVGKYIAVLDAFDKEYSGLTDKVVGELLSHRAELAVALNGFSKATTLKEVYAECVHLQKPSSVTRCKSNSAEGENAKVNMRKIDASVRSFLSTLKEDCVNYASDVEEDDKAAKYASVIFAIAIEAEKKYAEHKKKEGKLDFSDLEHLALKVLLDEDRRRLIASEYEYIFLDEYQDTNHLQESILNAVSENAKVFVVGDVKQCIYQFRSAEPQIFINRHKKYSSRDGGVSIPFNDNFRSDECILNYINKVFSELMTEDFGGTDYRKDAMFVAGLKKSEPVSDVRNVEYAVFDYESENRNRNTLLSQYDITADDSVSESKRDREGDYVAKKIKELVKTNIRDSKTGQVRKINYADITILVRTNNQANKIAKALKTKGVPTYVVGGGGDFYQEDRELLLSYLRLVDNLHDDVSLVKIMLSPLSDFSETELAEIRGGNKEGYFWTSVLTYSGTETLKNKINAFVRRISEYRALAAAANVRTLLEKIIRDTDYDAYIMGAEAGAERIEMQNIFLASLDRISAASELSRFISYAESAEWSFELPATAGDAVSIMTVHKAKGLEFPIVFLPYTAETKKGNFLSEKDVMLNRHLGVAMRFYDSSDKTKKDTVALRYFKSYEQNKSNEEMLRLMYVAMTRAKNHLFITASATKEEKTACFPDEHKTFADWINYATARNGFLASYVVHPTLQEESDEEICNAEDAASCEDFSPLSEEYCHKEAATTELKYTVSSLQTSEDVITRVSLTDDSVLEARKKGINYHAVLEHIDFNKTAKGDVHAVIADLIKKGVFSEEEGKALDIELICKVLSLPVFGKAAKAMELKRESGFMLYVPAKHILDDSTLDDKILVQGVLDLLILGKENIIVDYKYSSLPSAVIKQKYEKQLSTYKYAAEKLLGIKVDSTVLVLLKSAEEVEI